jgi:hypothetical protein
MRGLLIEDDSATAQSIELMTASLPRANASHGFYTSHGFYKCLATGG